MKAKPKIVLVVNAPERDERISRKIQSAIMRINPDAQVQILERCEPDMVTKTLEINPDVIMCAPITAQTTSTNFYILKYLLNCRLVCFRTEGVINFDSDIQIKINAGLEKYGANLVDYQVFWGPRMAETVGEILLQQAKLSSADRIRYYGVPSLEDYVRPVNDPDKMLPDSIKSKLNQYPREKILLFVTGFHLSEYSAEDITNAGDLVDNSSKTIQKDLTEALRATEQSRRFREMWVKAIIASAINNPEILFVVKTHPMENICYRIKKVYPYAEFSNYDNILLLTENLPFRAIVHRCSLLFHYGSTTALECYLLQVPSVYVISKELELENNKLIFFADIGIPFPISSDILDVPSIVSQHAAIPVQFQRSEKVEKYLEDIFDLRMDAAYNPSERIAEFLLSVVDEAPQLISSDDKYLADAFQYVGSCFIRELVDKCSSKVNANDFKGALFYLDKVLLLAKTKQFEVKKLQYLRSVCLYKEGLIDEAIEAVKQEIATNPYDKQAQHLSEQLQSLSGVKKISRVQGCKEFNQSSPKTFAVETVSGCALKCPEGAVGANTLRTQGCVSKTEDRKKQLTKEKPESNKAKIFGDNKLLLDQIAARYLIINPQIVMNKVSEIFQNGKINYSDPLFKELASNPQGVGLGQEDLLGKCDHRKMEMIAGEYLAKLSSCVSKVASKLLFNAQWHYGESEWFDHRHHLLDSDRWFTDFWTASADNVLMVLPLHGRLLDLCSGDGFYDYYFYRKRAKEVVCVEMNPDAYRHSCRLHKADNITYIKQSVFNYEPSESYYDVVVIRGAIEHFSQAEQQVIFNKALKALKPGGWFCGDTHTKSKTDQKPFSAHKYEWADENEMRRELSKVFDHVETYTMESDAPTVVDYTTLFWRCRKEDKNSDCIISEEEKNKLSNKQKHKDPRSINISRTRDIAFNLWHSGEKEKAWQYLLRVLELNPDDSQVQELHRQLQSALRGKTTMVVPHTRKNDKFVPKIFAVETILGCDLKCPECAIGADIITRKKGCMTFEQLKIIADKIRPFCEYLYLHIWGEPLLNKDIFEMIKYASAFTKTNISTNGNSLTKEKAEKLIASGVTDIIVSIDGISQDIYEQYRKSGYAIRAMWSLAKLKELNAKYGNKVNIIPQYLVFKHNQHEMDSFREFCNSIGLQPSYKAPYIHKNSIYQNSDYPQYIRSSYPDLESLKHAMQDCGNPKEVFTILLDGSCVICCYDHDGITNYGNIYEQDVMDIWNSPKCRQDRLDIMTANAPKYCLENCLEWTLCHTQGDGDVVVCDDFAQKDYNCSPKMITTDSCGLSNNIEQQTPQSASYGRRLIPHHDVSDGQKCLEHARKSFKNGNFNEAFDIYEQLSIAYPATAIEILAEVYDQYQRLPNQDRYSLYQSRIFNFGINPTDKVLDIGSGNIPFQLATHLADITINDNYYGRAGIPFNYLDGKSVLECNIENMPFEDKEFDFVCCSHVLEHVHNPQKACDELMRIGKRGYIETPTRAKDLWLNNAKVSNHRWSVKRVHDRLIFTEYAKDQIEGLGSDILSSMHCAPQSIREKAFSALIYLKAHLFNTMLLWENSFRYEVRTPNHSQTNVSEDVPVIVEG